MQYFESCGGFNQSINCSIQDCVISKDFDQHIKRPEINQNTSQFSQTVPFDIFGLSPPVIFPRDKTMFCIFWNQSVRLLRVGWLLSGCYHYC